jgi:hypothetical protein
MSKGYDIFSIYCTGMHWARDHPLPFRFSFKAGIKSVIENSQDKAKPKIKDMERWNGKSPD